MAQHLYLLLLKCLLSIWAHGHTKFTDPFYILCKEVIILGGLNAMYVLDPVNESFPKDVCMHVFIYFLLAILFYLLNLLG